jgi:hypothetical protein
MAVHEPRRERESFKIKSIKARESMKEEVYEQAELMKVLKLLEL